MKQGRKNLLDFSSYERKSTPHRSEKLCLANWHLEAFGPTKNIYLPAKATAAPILSSMAAPGALATSNMRSAITAFGPLGPRSPNASAIAKQRILSRNPNAPFIRNNWMMKSVKNLKAIAAKTAGTISWTGAAGVVATRQRVAVPHLQHHLRHLMQLAAHATVSIAAVVAIARPDAIAPLVASLREGRT
jgi:hypothetical protein